MPLETLKAKIDRLTWELSDARMEIATLKNTRDELVKVLEIARDTIHAHDIGDQSTETGWASDELLDAWMQINAALEKAKQP